MIASRSAVTIPAMPRRAVLILLLMLGQLLSVPAVVAVAAAENTHRTCCGGMCCCQPEMCGCLAPVPPNDTPAPASPPSHDTTRTLLASLFITGIDFGGFENIEALPLRAVAGDVPHPCTTPQRLARLCISRT